MTGYDTGIGYPGIVSKTREHAGPPHGGHRRSSGSVDSTTALTDSRRTITSAAPSPPTARTSGCRQQRRGVAYTTLGGTTSPDFDPSATDNVGQVEIVDGQLNAPC